MGNDSLTLKKTAAQAAIEAEEAALAAEAAADVADKASEHAQASQAGSAPAIIQETHALEAEEAAIEAQKAADRARRAAEEALAARVAQDAAAAQAAREAIAAHSARTVREAFAAQEAEKARAAHEAAAAQEAEKIRAAQEAAAAQAARAAQEAAAAREAEKARAALEAARAAQDAAAQAALAAREAAIAQEAEKARAAQEAAAAQAALAAREALAAQEAEKARRAQEAASAAQAAAAQAVLDAEKARAAFEAASATQNAEVCAHLAAQEADKARLAREAARAAQDAAAQSALAAAAARSARDATVAQESEKARAAREAAEREAAAAREAARAFAECDAAAAREAGASRLSESARAAQAAEAAEAAKAAQAARAAQDAAARAALAAYAARIAREARAAAIREAEKVRGVSESGYPVGFIPAGYGVTPAAAGGQGYSESETSNASDIRAFKFPEPEEQREYVPISAVPTGDSASSRVRSSFSSAPDFSSADGVSRAKTASQGSVTYDSASFGDSSFARKGDAFGDVAASGSQSTEPERFSSQEFAPPAFGTPVADDTNTQRDRVAELDSIETDRIARYAHIAVTRPVSADAASASGSELREGTAESSPTAAGDIWDTMISGGSNGGSESVFRAASPNRIQAIRQTVNVRSDAEDLAGKDGTTSGEDTNEAGSSDDEASGVDNGHQLVASDRDSLRFAHADSENRADNDDEGTDRPVSTVRVSAATASILGIPAATTTSSPSAAEETSATNGDSAETFVDAQSANVADTETANTDAADASSNASEFEQDSNSFDQDGASSVSASYAAIRASAMRGASASGTSQTPVRDSANAAGDSAEAFADGLASKNAAAAQEEAARPLTPAEKIRIRREAALRAANEGASSVSAPVSTEVPAGSGASSTPVDSSANSTPAIQPEASSSQPSVAAPAEKTTIDENDVGNAQLSTADRIRAAIAGASPRSSASTSPSPDAPAEENANSTGNTSGDVVGDGTAGVETPATETSGSDHDSETLGTEGVTSPTGDSAATVSVSTTSHAPGVVSALSATTRSSIFDTGSAIPGTAYSDSDKTTSATTVGATSGTTTTTETFIGADGKKVTKTVVNTVTTSDRIIAFPDADSPADNKSKVAAAAAAAAASQSDASDDDDDDDEEEDDENEEDDDASHEENTKRPKSKFGCLFLLFLLLLLLLGGAFWYYSNYIRDNYAPFSQHQITMGVIRGAVKATGTINPVKQVSISPEVSGLVEFVGKDSTDLVKKGDILARIDQVKFKQQLEAAEAAHVNAVAKLKEAETTYEETKANFNRHDELYKNSGGRSPSKLILEQRKAEFDRATAARDAAKETVREAVAQRDVRKTDLEKTVILSPIDGIVLKRSVQVGNTVQVSLQTQEIFVIAESLDSMKVVAGISEADIGKVKQGQEAVFTVSTHPQKEYKAKVTKVEVASTVTNNVVTYNVEIEVPNTDKSYALHSGMNADVQILVEESKQVSLIAPIAALNYNPNAGEASSKSVPFYKNLISFMRPPRRASSSVKQTSWRSENAQIYVLDSRGKIHPVKVTLGMDDGKNVEIFDATGKLAANAIVLTPDE